jgi:hypothetical protein
VGQCSRAGARIVAQGHEKVVISVAGKRLEAGWKAAIRFGTPRNGFA